MNQGFLAFLGRLVFASASLVIIQTAANAQESRLSVVNGGIAEKSNQEQRISENPAAYQLILAQTPRRRVRVNNAAVPQVVSNAVIQNLSQQTGIETSALKIVEAQRQTWENGCLGISSPGVPCAQRKVSGWKIVVGSGTQRWVYRSNMSGSLVKLDAIATQNIANRTARSRETSESAATTTTTRTSQGTVTQTPRPTSTSVSRPTPVPGTGEFSLAIWQPAANLSEVIARLSVMSKDSNFASERYIGDYRYQVNQRAKFVGGVNPGDRIVVRLYNYQNRLIGFTEFEVLPQKSSVNIILGNRPVVSRIVRIVYGADVDENAAIDKEANIYDFYTNITGITPKQESVIFPKNTQGIDKSWYQVAGLPVPPETGVFSNAVRGNLGSENREIKVFSANLPASITATPGSQKPIANVATNNESTFNLNSETATNSTQPTTPRTTEQTPVSTQSTNTEVTASFPDVPANYWARKFISRLAEKGVIQGYPDGLYRPRASLTRAEFAIVISGAFNQDKKREVVTFKDVNSSYWAYPAIREAYEMGFLDVDSRGNFRPDEKITRLDVLVAVAKGLNYAPTIAVEKTLRVYSDGANIPKGDRTFIAAVTERNIVVNYPYIRSLNPQRIATRAEVAALIYRALVSTGQVADISSPYVVGETTIPKRQVSPTRQPANNNSRS